MDYFAKNVKYLRRKKGKSQAEMASVAVITQAAWSEYELGTSKPRFAELKKITDYFCISYSELLDLDLSKLNLNEILELRKMLKKLNPNLNLSLNLNEENEGKKESGKKSNKGADTAVLDQLARMEEEIKKMRSKLGQ